MQKDDCLSFLKQAHLTSTRLSVCVLVATCVLSDREQKEQELQGVSTKLQQCENRLAAALESTRNLSAEVARLESTRQQEILELQQKIKYVTCHCTSSVSLSLSLHLSFNR